jgi:hypothetical protein
MSAMRSALCGFVLMVACTGGGGDGGGPDAGPDASPTSVMLSISDGAVIGGVYELSVDAAADPAGIVRVELYLDGDRIAELPFAPFDHDWDTRPHPEGTHELTARAYTTDARVATQTVSITLDNTAPTVGELQSGGEVGASLELPVADNIGIERVVISYASEYWEVTLTEPPWRTPWPGCMTGIQMTVTVIDRAGWRATGTAWPTVTDALDMDCDHFRPDQAQMQWNDCDDHDATVNPLANDRGDSFRDLDCDGVQGQDDDHDGVASVGTGGADCDDADPSIHGPAFRWQSSPVPGATALPYEVMMALDGAVAHLLFKDAAGVLRYRATSSPTYGGADEIVSDVGSESPAAVVMRAGQPELFFMLTTNELYHATRDTQGGGWRLTRLDTGSIWNTNVVVRVDAAGELHAVWGKSTGVRYARTVGGAWSSAVTLATEPNPGVDLVLEADGTRRVLFAATWPGEVVAPPGQGFGSATWIGDPLGVFVRRIVAMPGTSDVYLSADSNILGEPARLFRMTRTASGWTTVPGELATLGHGVGVLRAVPGHLFHSAWDSTVNEETTHHLAVIDGAVLPRTLIDGSFASAAAGADAILASSRKGVARLVQTIPAAVDGPDAVDRDCDGASD